MASSKAPKHDFAPAWLKIPEHANQKASGAKVGEHGADKNGYYGYSRRGGRDDMISARRQPFDYAGYPPAGMRHPPRNYDHSFDERHFNKHGLRGMGPHGYMEEEYYGAVPPGYYGNFQGPGYHPFPPHHPAARFNPHMGAYPQYAYGAYDIPTHERYHGGGRQRRPSRGNDKNSSSTTNSSSKASTEKASANNVVNGGTEKPANDEKGQSKTERTGDNAQLDDEFPSLNGEGDSKEEIHDKCKPSAGVWDSNSVEKIANLKHADAKDAKNNSPKDSKSSTTIIYKALVPSKGKLVNKRVVKDGKQGSSTSPRDINSNSSPGTKSIQESSSQPMDILNTRTVTQPRTLGDKKSDFLKALKQDNDLITTYSNKCMENGVNGVHHDHGENHAETAALVNGFSDFELLEDDSAQHNGHVELSSSLEAEQRLLREMGWSEDDDQKPITDEEIQALQSELSQLKKEKNGLRRPCSLTSPWSPQHSYMTHAQLKDAADSLTSSSDESDLDS